MLKVYEILRHIDSPLQKVGRVKVLRRARSFISSDQIGKSLQLKLELGESSAKGGLGEVVYNIFIERSRVKRGEAVDRFHQFDQSKVAFQDQRGGGGGGFQDDRPKYDITCSKCGNPGQVPFPPTAGRDVYCRDCFREMSPSRDNRGGGFRSR